MPLLQLNDIHVQIGQTEILRGVTFSLDPGQTLGIVGESGCGKSMTGLTVMGMLPAGGRITRGTLTLHGRDLTQISPRDWREIRGQEIALVMQDPFTSLNPLMKVGDQVAEVYRMHGGLSKASAGDKAVEMLTRVGVPSPKDAAHKYPHQMSGGQRQRVVIAIACAARPKVLIADEPTTALDVTLQAQVLRLLKEIQAEDGTAILMISHDIGVIGSVSDEIAVFYAGRVVEQGPTAAVLRRPFHLYTQALMAAMPQTGAGRLRVIEGQPPLLSDLGQACPFAPRCPSRFEACEQEPPLVTAEAGHGAACWKIESPVTAGG
jgi:oligopeptide transport system ATP-binding protein